MLEPADIHSAAASLAGQVIVSARVLPCSRRADIDDDALCSSVNRLELVLGDGRTITLEGGYGGHSGDTCSEYRETLSVYVAENPNLRKLTGVPSSWEPEAWWRHVAQCRDCSRYYEQGMTPAAEHAGQSA